MQDVAGDEVVFKLARLLQTHGDHVVRGDSKLCLTVSSLIYLNNRFEQIKTGQKICTDHARSAVTYLNDFLKKVVSLKLVPGNCSGFDVLLNVSCFKNLQYLEIKKVPLGYIKGLQSLRSQLRGLTCQRSVIALSEVFVSCGGDLTSSPFLWSELREANLSYNGIEQLDESLKILPKLEVLILSHNSIKSSDRDEYWQFFSELSYLNLGYNFLEEVPRVPCLPLCVNKLKKLILKNNNLQNLEGIQHFSALETLDVSNNCISTFEELSPMAWLEKLTSIYLDGNPVCFHPDYRAFTVSCLSPLQKPDSICLDGQSLSILEQYFVGSNVHPAPLQTYIPQTPLGKPKNLAFVNSPVDVLESSQDVSNGILSTSTGGKPRGRGRKKARARQIAITDTMKDSTNSTSETGTPDTTTNLDKSLEHLEDIRRLEKARDLGGEYWLPAISRVVYGEVPSTSVDPAIDQETASPLAANSILTVDQGTASSLGVLKNAQVMDNKPQEDVEIPSPSKNLVDLLHTEPVDGNEGDKFDVRDGKTRSPSTSSVERLLDSEHEPFLVSLLPSLTDNSHKDSVDGDEFRNEETQFLVIVTEDFIREIDSIELKVVCKLETGCLVSASSEQTDKGEFVIHLKFDYMRRERKERHYLMEDGNKSEHMMSLLLPLLEVNLATGAVSEMEHLECLKCSAQFTEDAKSSTPHVCPDCASTQIVQRVPPDMSAESAFFSRDGSRGNQARDSPLLLNGANLNESSTHNSKSSNPGTVLVPFPFSRPPESKSKPGDSWCEEVSSWKPPESAEINGDRFATANYVSKNDESFVINTKNGIYDTKSSPQYRTSVLSNSLRSSSGCDSEQEETVKRTKRVFESPVALKTSSKPSSTDSSLEKEATVLQPRARTPVNQSPNILKSLFNKLSGKISGVSLSSSQDSSSSESQVSHPAIETPRQLGFQLSADDHRSFDHRLQLYCEVSLFKEGTDEKCVCLLKAPVVVYGLAEEMSALLIASDRAIYICSLNESGCSSPDECLSLLASHPLHTLRFIDIGLHSQSFRLEFDTETPGCYSFIVRDKDRCERFLTTLSECIRSKAHLESSPPTVTRDHPQTLWHVRCQVLGVLDEEPADTANRLQEQAMQFAHPPLIKDRKSLLRTYSRCFVGKEFIDFLMRTGEVTNRVEAVSFAQKLLDAGAIENTSKETKFEDKEQFYKFSEIRKQRSLSEPGENGHQNDTESLADCDVIIAAMVYQYQDPSEPGASLPVTVIVSRTHIALAKQSLQWPVPRFLEPSPLLEVPEFECLARFQMTDITGLEFYEDSPCYMGVFISEEDYSHESDVFWLLKTQTVSGLSHLLKALKEPWEKQFVVELPTTLHPTLRD
ncbi:serine/threonine-protein kinase 11-interacting protein isoform X3 [Nematostella vectensis]|uniref:serine/threonine-protein kinase 11-interacting protein isoform X3 n=1 Tax=Nematostella vectensis TaxID=45351 RepID=UPI0020776061|nr:serine/threonine-protein kinase 11-interacting protein isoform X3 [Nematostella vectensis]